MGRKRYLVRELGNERIHAQGRGRTKGANRIKEEEGGRAERARRKKRGRRVRGTQSVKHGEMQEAANSGRRRTTLRKT